MGSRVLTSLHGCSKPCRFYDRARRQCGPRQPVSVRMALRQSAEEGPLTHACSTHPSGAIQAFSLQGPTEREKVGHDSPLCTGSVAPLQLAGLPGPWRRMQTRSKVHAWVAA